MGYACEEREGESCVSTVREKNSRKDSGEYCQVGDERTSGLGLGEEHSAYWGLALVEQVALSDLVFAARRYT